MDIPAGKGCQQPTLAESLVSAKGKSSPVLTVEPTTKPSGDILDELFGVDSDPCAEACSPGHSTADHTTCGVGSQHRVISYSTPLLAALEEEGELESPSLNPNPTELLSPASHSTDSPSAGQNSYTSPHGNRLSGKKFSLKLRKQSLGGIIRGGSGEVPDDTNRLLQSQHSTCSLHAEQVVVEPTDESEASVDSDFPVVVWKGNTRKLANSSASRLHSCGQVGEDDKDRMDTNVDCTPDLASPSITADEKDVSLSEQGNSMRNSESLLDITNRSHSSSHKGQLHHKEEDDNFMVDKADNGSCGKSRSPQPTPLKQALNNIPKADALLDTAPDTVDLTG